MSDDMGALQAENQRLRDELQKAGYERNIYYHALRDMAGSFVQILDRRGILKEVVGLEDKS